MRGSCRLHRRRHATTNSGTDFERRSLRQLGIARRKCQHPQQRHAETGDFVRRKRHIAATIQGNLVIQLDAFRIQGLRSLPDLRGILFSFIQHIRGNLNQGNPGQQAA